MDRLILKAWLGLVVLAAAMGALVFAPAGTIHYWQAWQFLGIYFAASILITVYLMRHDRALLERRMAGGPTAEKAKTQKVIMLFASIGFLGLLVIPGLDRRSGWSHISIPGVVFGDLLVAAGWLIIFLVFRENSFSSATIGVAADQEVISTGPYSLVRHPMYVGGLLLFLGIPLALGSYWGLVPAAATIPFLVWRIFDEEKLLRRNLPGYREYCASRRWRLIPGIF
jgi:protein-S-isoprenylcysteine O-methyltransferase Ste14